MPSEIKTPKQTLVEAGTEFKGTLKSSCPIVVNGTIDGEIDAPTLNITATGVVVGDVKVMTLRSQGILSGKVVADEVFVSGGVRSNTVIKAKRLEFKISPPGKGQLTVTFSECDLDVLHGSSEPDANGTPLASPASPASTDSDNELFVNSGWDTDDVAIGTTTAASASRDAASNPGRSEGSSEDPKQSWG